MFYTFRQNNSGGLFRFDEANGITYFVVIEADKAEEACEIAVKAGVYFDGRGDCSCCGNRWHEVCEEDGTAEPEVYGHPVATFECRLKWMKENPEIFVHYKDGSIKGFCYGATDE